MTNKTHDVDHYDNYPLVQSLLLYESTRTTSLKEEGKIQINHARSNDGWASTIFIIQGRALDGMLFPWLVAVLHAIAYTVIHELVFYGNYRDPLPWENVFG